MPDNQHSQEHRDKKNKNQIAENSVIQSECEISNSILKEYSRLKRNVEFRNSLLGAYSYVSSFSVVNATDIGKFCSIAHGSFIGLWEHNTFTSTHSFYLYETSGGFVKGYKDYEQDKIRTSLGNDVWIGANVVVKKGVNIGSGSIVGAGSVVTKDVEPFCIVFGNPAKKYKYRFNEKDRKFLLESQWWNFEREVIQDMVDKNVWYSINDLKEYITSNNLR